MFLIRWWEMSWVVFPKNNNKDGCLIKVFIEPTPHSIGRRMFINLNTERHNDNDDFLCAFMNTFGSFTRLYEPNAWSSHNAQISARVSSLSDSEHLTLLEQQFLENVTLNLTSLRVNQLLLSMVTKDTSHQLELMYLSSCLFCDDH